MKKSNIGVIGLWHLGCIYAASLARMGHRVTGIDFDIEVVENLRGGKPPLFEPELEETIKKYKKTLSFTTDWEEFFKNKDYIFITFDLPVDNNDRVSLDLMDKLQPILKKHLGENTTVVISSQVPLGTCRNIVKLLNKSGRANSVMYFPENLRLGTAFDAFLKADRIILGSDNQEDVEIFKKELGFSCPVIGMKLESAEMVKHALNTYLATCISFSSELSDLSEMLGADMNEVVTGLKTDIRVSPKAPLLPGLGFAGGTLGRDIQSLKKLGAAKKYKTKLMNAVYEINSDRLPYLLKKIKRVLPRLKGKTVGILGLTYKPGTSTLRRSMSLGLAALLKKNGVKIAAYDPMIHEKIKEAPYIQLALSAEHLAKLSDVLILMTEWPDFKNLDPFMMPMEKKLLIDTKNFLDKKIFEQGGFTVIGTGY
jgi:UDPglucose 6-dehydrogenase